MLLFLEAFALGIAVSAPPGPVNAYVIRNALLYGFATSLAIGLGAAAVDGVYFMAAVAGANEAFKTAWLGAPLCLVGAAFLGYLGLSGLRARVSDEEEVLSYSLRKAFARGVAVTASNPLTIASWLAVAGSLAVSSDKVGLLVSSAAFVVAGSIAWTTFLSGSIAWSRRWASETVLHWSAIGASVVIFAFAVRFLMQGLYEYVL